MKQRKTGQRLTAGECVMIAALVLALAATGVVAIGYVLNDLFTTVRFPQ